MVDFSNHDDNTDLGRLVREQLSLMTEPVEWEDGVSMHETLSLTEDFDVKKLHTTFETDEQRIRVSISDHGVTGPSRWRPRLEPMDPHAAGGLGAFQAAHDMAKRGP